MATSAIALLMQAARIPLITVGDESEEQRLALAWSQVPAALTAAARSLPFPALLAACGHPEAILPCYPALLEALADLDDLLPRITADPSLKEDIVAALCCAVRSLGALPPDSLRRLLDPPFGALGSLHPPIRTLGLQLHAALLLIPIWRTATVDSREYLAQLAQRVIQPSHSDTSVAVSWMKKCAIESKDLSYALDRISHVRLNCIVVPPTPLEVLLDDVMKGCDWPMDAATLVVASCCQFILLQATLPESPPERQGTCINIATGLLSSFSRHCADSGSNLVRIELFRGCWTLALQLMWSSSALSQPHHQSILTRILPLLCTLLPPFPDGHCDGPHTVMFLLDTVQRLATISKPIFGVDEVAAVVTRVCSSSSFCFDLFVRGSLACISNCDGTPSSLATSKALVPVLAACLVSPSVPSAANVIAQGVLEALSHLAGPFHMTVCLVSSLLQLCAEGCLEDPIRLEVVAWSKRSLQYLQQLWKGVTMTTCMAKQDAAVGEQLQFAGNCVKILSSLSIIPAEFRTAVVALLPCLPQKDAIAVLVAVQHLIDGDSDPWKPRLQTIALKHVCNTAAIFPCLL